MRTSKIPTLTTNLKARSINYFVTLGASESMRGARYCGIDACRGCVVCTYNMSLAISEVK